MNARKKNVMKRKKSVSHFWIEVKKKNSVLNNLKTENILKLNMAVQPELKFRGNFLIKKNISKKYVNESTKWQLHIFYDQASNAWE